VTCKEGNEEEKKKREKGEGGGLRAGGKAWKEIEKKLRVLYVSPREGKGRGKKTSSFSPGEGKVP